MRSRRYLWFAISIVVGIAGGMVYGWLVNPVQYVDTPLSSLRSDYKADYVLMVAEIYATDQDLNLAGFRLSWLGEETPLRPVQQAIITAQELGYDPRDIELMAALAKDIAALPAPTPAAGGTP